MTASLAAPPRSTIAVPARRHGAGATIRTRSAAVERAYARRAQRTSALSTPGDRSDTVGRTRFVVLVMVLLGAALVATLWLSTASAADSYRLQHAQEAAGGLTERSEQLGREVAALETAPQLAHRALKLGMVPAGNPARLVVGPDGAVKLVGEPEAAAPGPVPHPAAPSAAALTSLAAVPSGA